MKTLKQTNSPPPINEKLINQSIDVDEDGGSGMTVSEWSKLSTCRIIRIVLAGAAGNFLEWFDFSIFGLLANYLGDNFFPSKNNDNSLQLLFVFSIYAIGFIVRPFGGTIFGYIGDKYGRLFALQITILMMSTPTFLTGCLPTYHTIGVLAPILLIILRIIQGLAVGGEGAGSLVYILELCPPNKRSLFGILVQISSGGAVLANAIIAVCSAYLTDKQMKDYGWRIPFLCGLFLTIFGIRLRYLLPKSLTYEKNKNEGKLVQNPLSETIRNHKCKMVAIFCHLCFPNTAYYAEFLWLTTYFTNKKLRHNDDTLSNAYQINTYGILAIGLVSIVSGYIGDYIKPYKILLFGGITHVLCILYIFPKLQYSDEWDSFFYVIIFSITFGIYYGPVSVWGINMLPQSNTRYTAYGISQNISIALFSGTVPLLATIITQNYGIKQFGWLLTGYAILSLGTNLIVSCNKIVNGKNKHINQLDYSQHYDNVMVK